MAGIPTVTAIVPAAGSSRRFGRAKLVEVIAGLPLIAHTVRSLLAGGIDRVVVVQLTADQFSDIPSLVDERVSFVVNPDPSRGMFSSVQAGLQTATAGVIVVLPADMPFVEPVTVRLLVEQATNTDQVVIPVYEGNHGHPVVFPARLRPALLAADAMGSLKHALSHEETERLEVRVEDRGVLRDVDTPGDLRPE